MGVGTNGQVEGSWTPRRRTQVFSLTFQASSTGKAGTRTKLPHHLFRPLVRRPLASVTTYDDWAVDRKGNNPVYFAPIFPSFIHSPRGHRAT